MGGGPYYVLQGGSRILSATRADQSGADDVDVTNWTKTNDFILAVCIYRGDKDTEGAQYKLRWRNKTDGGSFVDVGAATEINYNADTALTNGGNIYMGGRKCSTQGESWDTGREVEGVASSASINLPSGYETEVHFALDCSGATNEKEYEFELYDDTIEVTRGTCGATIAMEAGAVTRELVTTIAATTTTTAAMGVLRELTSAIAVTTSLSEITLLVGTIRELTTTMAVTTGTSTPELTILREITSSLATQTDSTASLSILREIAATISAATTLSEIELITATLRELSATIAASTTTSVGALDVLRETIATVGVQTASAATLDILREIQATVAAGTSLSQIELITATLRELATTVATQTDSTATLVVLREMQAAIAADTSLSEIELLITGIVEFTTTIAASTSTSAVTLAVLRELISTIAASTATSTSELSILRELISSMDAQSASSASINVLREIQAIVAAGISLSEIELLVEALRELATTIAASTITSSPNLDAMREFTTTIAATTSTSDISLVFIRALLAQIAAGTDAGDAVLLVLRELSATVDAGTVASTIELVLTAAELLVDTEIQSLTPIRTTSSLTTVREIQEM